MIEWIAPNSRRARTHEKNLGETVRRLGPVIQSIFCGQSGAGIRFNFWKWFDESRYPGALSPASPDPTDCSWVSEDEMGYGLCTSIHSSLELGMFLRRSYFFIIWRYDLFNVSGNRVRAVTACHPLRSRAGFQGFRSEIGYGKSLILV